MVAVAQLLRARQRWQHRSARNATDAFERIDDGQPLQFQLVLVGDVLPLTAAAIADVAAGRGNAVRRWFNDFNGARDDVAAPLTDDLGNYLLARYPADNEYLLAVRLGHGLAEAAHAP